MTAGFSHRKSAKTSTKDTKKKSAMDELLEATNIVCTLNYALDNIDHLTESEMLDVLEALENSKVSRDAQVKIVVQTFVTRVEELNPPKTSKLNEVFVLLAA
jgi:hypothetical protein